MRIPPNLTAGDSASWQDIAFTRADSTAVSSAGGWALTYSLRGQVVAGNIDLLGVAQGSGWKTSLTAAQSAALNTTPGTVVWYWQAFATLGAERATAGEGTLLVKPNISALATNVTFDGRSPAETTLAAIESEISARINNGASLEYSIGNRSLKREPLTTLLTLRSSYRLMVSRERRSQAIANGLGNPSRVGVRFK